MWGINRMGDFDKIYKKVRGDHLGTSERKTLEGREEVGVSGRAPAGPEIPGVPFCSEFSKRVAAEGRGSGHLPVRAARAVSGPQRSVLLPAWRSAAAARLRLPRRPPPPPHRIRRRPQPAFHCVPACGRVLLRVPVRSRPSPALRFLQPLSSSHSLSPQVCKFGVRVNLLAPSFSA